MCHYLLQETWGCHYLLQEIGRGDVTIYCKRLGEVGLYLLQETSGEVSLFTARDWGPLFTTTDLGVSQFTATDLGDGEGGVTIYCKRFG